MFSLQSSSHFSLIVTIQHEEACKNSQECNFQVKSVRESKSMHRWTVDGLADGQLGGQASGGMNITDWFSVSFKSGLNFQKLDEKEFT